MSTEKLTIHYEQATPDVFSGELKLLFNPAQLAYSSSATWEHVDPALGDTTTTPGTTVFRAVAPDTLTLNLFFDTYAPYASDKAGGRLGAAAASVAATATSRAARLAGAPPPRPASVAADTSKVIELARVVPALHRPPVCLLHWGPTSSTLFCGVLQQATRTYTLFLPDGTPVRATMECTFLAVVRASDKAEVHSADVPKRYVVRPGDTLMGIAAAHFGDGALWRRIADANDIDNPRALTPGRTLALPKVR